VAITLAATHFEPMALPGDAVDELCDLGVHAHCCLFKATSLETLSARLTAWRVRHRSSRCPTCVWLTQECSPDLKQSIDLSRLDQQHGGENSPQ